MANQLQKIARRGWLGAVLLALSLPGPASAEFSHRIHLAQKLECAVCHSAAFSSTQTGDSLLPNADLCVACHTGETGKGPKLASEPVIKQPAKTGVDKFNHRLHVRMGNIAAVIARAIDTKNYLSEPGDARKHLDTKNVCGACHRGMESFDAVTPAAFPRMADCLVCHNKIDPPFTCSKCHLEDAKLKPADHTPDFVDAHSSGKLKDKTACAVCHGRQFTCLGCH